MSTKDDLETLPEPATDSRAEGESRTTLGFVVAWSPGEPSHQGAFIPVEAGHSYILGRGASGSGSGERATGQRAVALRQRPSGNEVLPPLLNPALSRVQSSFEGGDDYVRVRNHGKLPLKVNGVRTEDQRLFVGDVAELGSALVLLCVRRPVQLPKAGEGFEFGTPDGFGIVGESPAIWALRVAIERCAGLSGHVLILGESGVGKELVAHALHVAARRPGQMITRNAATIPESLVDAELFGNVKGYPNPGLPDRPGLVGAADQGTLFLDEFADLPEAAQSHLLRVLDSGEYQRLGESRARTSRFRMLAATSRSEALLRKDLAARFELTLHVPPLSARREDIPWLVTHLLNGMTAEDSSLRARAFRPDGLPSWSTAHMSRLLQTRFEANVRQLRQSLWRSLLAEHAEGPLERPEDETTAFSTPSSFPPDARLPSLTGAPPSGDGRSHASREGGEPGIPSPEIIQAELDRNNGSIELTYRALGLSSRHVLSRLAKKHGLRVTRKKASA